MGVSSVVTQLLIIREFLTQFQGNEIVISLIFFNWLVLGGVGTLLARAATRGRASPTTASLGWLSLLMAALPALQLYFIRAARDTVFLHGASVGFYPTLGFTLATVAPYCLLDGFILPYALFVLREDIPDYPGARVYIADNLGDVAGGALFSFFLVYFLSPLQAIALANLPLAASACRLHPPGRRRVPLAAAVPVAGSMSKASPTISASAPPSISRSAPCRAGKRSNSPWPRRSPPPPAAAG